MHRDKKGERREGEGKGNRKRRKRVKRNEENGGRSVEEDWCVDGEVYKDKGVRRRKEGR